MGMESQFLKHINKSFTWSSKTTILIAVSGGVDSMVLLHLLHTLPSTKKPKLAVAHVNHELREASKKEEAFVREYCSHIQVPLYVESWPQEQHPSSGIENAARKVRYHFFEKIMKEKEISTTVTAHHLNDQTETILMRFVRGNTITGLTGMEKERSFGTGTLARPLLPFSKTEIYQYAKEQGIPYMEDESNQTLEFTRNRYRNEIIPILRMENPQVDSRLLSFSEELKDLLVVSNVAIEEAVQTIMKFSEQRVELDKRAFSLLNPHMQRLVLRKVLEDIYSKRVDKPNNEQVNKIQNWIIYGKPNSEIHLPNGYLIFKEYETVLLGKKRPTGFDFESSKLLNMNQWVEISKNKKIGIFDEEHIPPSTKEQQTFYVSSGKVEFPFLVRLTRPGDRIQLKGGGSKKISRIFIDQKVPKRKREEAVLVEDAFGVIIWVPGFKESALSIKDETDTIQYILVYEDKK